MATWLENQRDKARRDKLSREMTHQQSYGQTSPQAQAMLDYARVTQDPNYVEQGLEGGVPTENVTGLGLSPLDLIGTGLGTKAAAFGGSMLAALAGTAIASKASKGAKLSELAMAMPSQRGIFAGVGAKTANREALAKAEQLKTAGVPDEQIWKETGWTFGFPDQKPRFEIPDNAAKLKQLPIGKGDTVFSDNVFEGLSHPELQNAWSGGKFYSKPTLRITNSVDSPHGAYIDNLDSIVINSNEKNDALSTTLHELQHAIQQREGFARGGSPESMARELPSEIDLSHAQIIATRMQNGETPSQAAQWIKEKLGASPSIQAMDLGSSGATKAFAQTSDPVEAYRRLAGEAEARLTQSRMSMTPEQRLANYPVSQFDVPVDQQIVRYGDGQAMSVNKNPWEKTKAEYEATAPLKPQQSLFIDTGAKNKVEVIRNPSDMDIQAMRKEAISDYGKPSNGDPVLRSTEDANGNRYYFKSNDAVHAWVEPQLSKLEGVEINQNASQKLSHQGMLRRALYEGQAVPDSILKDYPTLADEVRGIAGNKMQAMSVPAKTEFELAHEVAQRNAALPVEQGGLGLHPDNTAMDRAKAMGFDTPAVHFSRHGVDVSELDSGKFAIAPFDAVGTHVGTEAAALERFNNTVGYKVNNPQYANDTLTGAAYPVSIRTGREMLDANGNPFAEQPLSMGWSENADFGNLRNYNKSLREKVFSEFDSIPYINDVEAAGKISYIVPPKNIRSRFAAFDPMQRNSANLLAGGAAGAIGLSSLADLMRQQEYQ